MDFGLCGSEILSCGGVWISLGSRKRERDEKESGKDRERESVCVCDKQRRIRTKDRQNSHEDSVHGQCEGGGGVRSDTFLSKSEEMLTPLLSLHFQKSFFSRKSKMTSYRCYFRTEPRHILSHSHLRPCVGSTIPFPSSL